jgi:hypothetical protein
MKAWHVPLRLSTGAYILNAGLEKRSVEEEQARFLHQSAVRAVPALDPVEPPTFAKVLSTWEIALGAGLLTPFVPAWLAGAGLVAFSGALLRMYVRSPDLHEPDSIRPSPQGSGIAKDVWMMGIGLSLLVDAATSRRHRDDD